MRKSETSSAKWLCGVDRRIDPLIYAHQQTIHHLEKSPIDLKAKRFAQGQNGYQKALPIAKTTFALELLPFLTFFVLLGVDKIDKILDLFFAFLRQIRQKSDVELNAFNILLTKQV